MSLKPKVALSSEFLAQLAKLPSNIHTKVLKWAIGFQTNPTSSGTNYENIKGARDPNLKSVRVDGDWRGIVFKPSAGEVYVLLYVGPHDEAYRWAENRKLTINPVTGAMQLVALEHVAEQAPAADPLQPAAASPANAAPVTPKLFAVFDDRELMSLGVPQELLEDVRFITNDAELDAIQARLPVEAYEGLFLVAAGDTISQVLTARESRVDKVIDTDDFAAALSTPESQSRFIVVDNDETLAAILNAPLAQWRVFLHPSQRKLTEKKFGGPARVLGGAGTGKTVLAMHRARWLAEKCTGNKQKVLFTTFTRNLATDIEQNLRTLCSAATLEKLEVRNLDAWVHGFMRSCKLEHRIVYNRKRDGAKQAWDVSMAVKDDALDLPDNFYEQELEQVILAQGITTLDEYRKARRTGRGVLLSRAKRDAVWPVFEEYRGQLASRKLKEVDDAYREVASMLDVDKSLIPSYSAVVIDETQDFGPQALRLLRAMIPAGENDLFFVGDGHQRIYSRHRAAMSKCGIDIRGRSRKLYVNYRTTDEIRQKAVALLEGVEVDDLDDGQDESSRYRSLTHGPVPLQVVVSGLEEAGEKVQEFLHQWPGTVDSQPPQSFCVVAASEKNRDTLELLLQKAGERTVTISAQSNHAEEQGVVHMATMHRAKGLEFDYVAIVAPSSYVGEHTEESNRRQLLYVALTRAKRGAILVIC